MKIPLLAITGLLAIHLSSGAATYFADFEDEVLYPGPQIAGSDGWTSNEPPLSSTSFLAFWNSDFAAGFGGLLGNPVNPTVNLSHAYSSDFGTIGFSFEFAFLDSSNARSSRDTFTVGFLNSGANVFMVEFKPRDQSATPQSGPDAIWDLFYKVGAGPSVSLTQGVLEGATYGFNMAFSPNGSTTDFTLATDGSTTELRSGNLAINPFTSVTDFSFGWVTTNGASNSGSNYVVFDDLALVPEPSSTLLACLAGLAMVARRKRA